ncbi:vacuolar protein sorting-associated protein-like [Vairimorpha necatrix]|uniref:Vacuolar protein sorting-associated protein-like n=1 Tax=Vairimorpha necatrix TaxID=6039 RepID=A0AAX4JAC1_9MICR
MIPIVRFSKISQNSLLSVHISLSPQNIPDCLFIFIESFLITSFNKIKILSSVPLFYEPKRFSFFYKCLIPYNCIPSFTSEFFSVKYSLVIILVRNKNKNRYEYEFTVGREYSYKDCKVDLFIDSDMVRIDEEEDETCTGFTEIIKFLRNNQLSKNDDIDDKIDASIINSYINDVYKSYQNGFNDLINKYKNKGDIFYYLKKPTRMISKTIKSEIKDKGDLVMTLKYDHLFIRSLNLEMEFHKDMTNLKIYLVRTLCALNPETKLESTETKLEDINIGFMRYKKIKIKKKWEDFPIKTTYFEKKMFIKICIDEHTFKIYPIL